MKTLNLYLLASIHTFTACGNGFKNSEQTKDANAELPAIVKEQLEYAMTKGTVQNSASGKIRLAEYKYRGTLQSREDVKKVLAELFTDSTYVVQNPYGPNYGIVTLKEAKQMTGRDELYKPTKVSLDTIVKTGMYVIDLVWDCNGKRIPSTAIASGDRGIVYDHIGSTVIVSRKQVMETYEVVDGDTILLRRDAF